MVYGVFRNTIWYLAVSMTDFTTLDYLQHGTPRQQHAFITLQQHQVFEILRPFYPILVGTIPINIDLPTSDLDIICCFTDKEIFKNTLNTAFGKSHGFVMTEFSSKAIDTIVVNFEVADFPIEIFAQPIPTTQQYGYRHMIIEHRLLIEKGEDFRQQIITLKRNGYKTEPAFAHLLGLIGDPYEVLLQLDVA